MIDRKRALELYNEALRRAEEDDDKVYADILRQRVAKYSGS